MSLSWLEVSLSVDGELAEAVADVLARFAPNGVMTEQGVEYAGAEDEGTALGPVTVRAYLEMDEKIEETRQKLDESLYYLGMIQPVPAPVYRRVEDMNWMEAWKQHYKPIPVGRRLIIVPVWMDSPDIERIPIKIDPGMAFGTGTHPTTQLCLELTEAAFDLMKLGVYTPLDGTRATVIDIGCGSGILSIAARKLGAKAVLGVDIDLDSVKNSQQNARKNGIGEQLVIGHGSVAEVLAGKFGFRRAPLVLANILAPVIIRLFDEGLADLVEAGGTLVVSGILHEQAEAVIKAGQDKGMLVRESRQSGDWVALAFVS